MPSRATALVAALSLFPCLSACSRAYYVDPRVLAEAAAVPPAEQEYVAIQVFPDPDKEEPPIYTRLQALAPVKGERIGTLQRVAPRSRKGVDGGSVALLSIGGLFALGGLGAMATGLAIGLGRDSLSRDVGAIVGAGIGLPALLIGGLMVGGGTVRILRARSEVTEVPLATPPYRYFPPYETTFRPPSPAAGPTAGSGR
jgi:hypothetical protein